MRRLIIVGILVWCAGFAHAITVQIDYTYDTGFFGSNAAAQAAVEKAAADLSSALTNSLGAVPTNTFTGMSGGRTVTLEWSLFFDNPSNPANEIEISDFTSLFPANTIRMYVGATSLEGPLGVGGPAGGGYAITLVGDAADGPALINAANASNTSLNRGAGPIMGTFEESVPGTSVDLTFGMIAGRLSLDSNASWHFNINTPPAPGTFDLYSVALHEMIHAIGFGASESWFDEVNGTNWLGPNVIALTDGGVNVLNPGQDHIKSGTLSPRLSDGVLQLAVMDPAIAAGTRKELTELDLAFLRDIGFTTVPEPGTIALVALALIALGGRQFARRRA